MEDVARRLKSRRELRALGDRALAKATHEAKRSWPRKLLNYAREVRQQEALRRKFAAHLAAHVGASIFETISKSLGEEDEKTQNDAKLH